LQVQGQQVARSALAKVGTQFETASGLKRLTGKREGVSNFIVLSMSTRIWQPEGLMTTLMGELPRPALQPMPKKSKLVSLFRGVLNIARSCQVIHHLKPDGYIKGRKFGSALMWMKQ